jgi:adenylate cyclase
MEVTFTMRFKIKPFYLILIILMIFGYKQYEGINYANNIFTDYENMLQDKCFQTPNQNDIDESLILITIGDESIKKLGAWPWSRSYHAKLIDLLSQEGVSAIGMDIVFSESPPDLLADKALVAASKKSGNVVFAAYGEMPERTNQGLVKLTSLFEPFSELKAVSSSGHINVYPDSDGIVRKSLNYVGFNNRKIDSFALAIYKQYLSSTGKSSSFTSMPQNGFNQSYIDFADRSGKFTTIPYYRVLNGEFKDFFKTQKNCIILVGPYAPGLNDSYKTSIDKKAPMYGLEIHANILNNMLHDNFKKEAPYFINLVVLVLFSIVSYLYSLKFNPTISFLVVLFCSIGYYFLAKFVYGQGYILSLFYPLVLLLFTYFTILAYDFFRERFEKKRITRIFGRYVAPQIVDQILKNGEESLQLGGTRRIITVLFVDIRGFTPMSEKAQPEEVVDILNDYLDLCAKSIFQFQGTLDKFIGDATMAIFNAPLDLDNHALKAVQTAWAMKQGSEALQTKLELKFGRSVQFGIGINTGFAVVGNIGSKTRMDYTAIGDTVNTGARLEANAKAGQILLSQTTYELVKDYVKVTSLGEINVKGKTIGIPIYQLEGFTNEENH